MSYHADQLGVVNDGTFNRAAQNANEPTDFARRRDVALRPKPKRQLLL